MRREDGNESGSGGNSWDGGGSSDVLQPVQLIYTSRFV